MAKDWTAHNNRVFEKILQQKADNIEARIEKVFRQVAEDVIVFIEGANEIPIYTGNLADSTGLGIYRNGVLTSYLPTKKAVEPQTFGYNQNVWGADELQRALNVSATEFATGIWLVLFSAVPYALFIEDKYNYFEDGVVQDLLQQFYSAIRAEFPTISTV